tara:strand:- start:7 stop:432 length:426 start_codon:yes stop_codon:yes gene_type:complete
LVLGEYLVILEVVLMEIPHILALQLPQLVAVVVDPKLRDQLKMEILVVLVVEELIKIGHRQVMVLVDQVFPVKDLVVVMVVDILDLIILILEVAEAALVVLDLMVAVLLVVMAELEFRFQQHLETQNLLQDQEQVLKLGVV